MCTSRCLSRGQLGAKGSGQKTMSEGKQIWHPAGLYLGVFDGFVVQANRHIAEHGVEIAWHSTSYSNSGDYGRQRDYWAIDGRFRKSLKQTLNMDVTITSASGNIITEPIDAERKATVKALSERSTERE